jgi:hypothetical protein
VYPPPSSYTHAMFAPGRPQFKRPARPPMYPSCTKNPHPWCGSRAHSAVEPFPHVPPVSMLPAPLQIMWLLRCAASGTVACSCMGACSSLCVCRVKARGQSMLLLCLPCQVPAPPAAWGARPKERALLEPAISPDEWLEGVGWGGRAAPSTQLSQHVQPGLVERPRARRSNRQQRREFKLGPGRIFVQSHDHFKILHTRTLRQRSQGERDNTAPIRDHGVLPRS